MRYFDLHCDTLGECAKKKIPLKSNSLQLNLTKGQSLFPWFQCFAVWIPDELRGPRAFDYFCVASHYLQSEIKENQSKLMQCCSVQDLHEATKNQKIGAILTIEGGAAIAGDLGNIPRIAKMGVKVLTLTWNGSCEIGDGAGVSFPCGLTQFGKQAVQLLEKHHIVIDVSHASDSLFYDVASETSAPVIATHSDSRAVCAHKRNLTNEQFEIIRDRGGLVGLNFCPLFLSNKSNDASMTDVLRHAEHFLSLGGENILAMGSDFDGTDLPKDIKGLESIETLAEEFLRNGYSAELVDKIFYKNAYDFFERQFSQSSSYGSFDI